MDRVPEPADGTERKLLLGWLSFHRNALEANCAGLTDDELTTRSAMPSSLSLQGLVRHLTEMEHFYLVHAISGVKGEFSWLYCTDESPDGDLDLLHPGEAQASLQDWRGVQAQADALLLKGNSPTRGRATAGRCGGT